MPSERLTQTSFNMAQAAHEPEDEGRDVLPACERFFPDKNDGIDTAEAIRRRYCSMIPRNPSTVMEGVEVNVEVPYNLIPILSLDYETEQEIREETELAAVDSDSCQPSSQRPSVKDRLNRHRLRATSASAESKATQTDPDVELKYCICKTKPTSEISKSPCGPTAKTKHWSQAGLFTNKFFENRQLRQDRYTNARAEQIRRISRFALFQMILATSCNQAVDGFQATVKRLGLDQEIQIESDRSLMLYQVLV